MPWAVVAEPGRRPGRRGAADLNCTGARWGFCLRGALLREQVALLLHLQKQVEARPLGAEAFRFLLLGFRCVVFPALG